MTVDLSKLQKVVYQNKLDKGFNTTNIAQEFCRAHEELSEAFKKHHRKQDGVAEELADVAIFLLGMAEILDFDLEKEILEKIEINKNREYKEVNGAMVRVKTDEDP